MNYGNFENYLCIVDTKYQTLQKLYDEGTIKKDALQNYVLKKREEIIKQYPRDLLFDNKNRQWYVYYYDEKGKRQQKTSKTKEKVEDFIIKEVLESQNSKLMSMQINEMAEKLLKNKELTIKNLYPEFIKLKSKKTRKPSYLSKIQTDWRRFYEKDEEFINKPICEMNEAYLDEWCHDIVKKFDLTSKAYHNMIVIAREILDLCTPYKYDIIPTNWLRNIKIKKDLFKVVVKKPSVEEVFTEEETEKLVRQLMINFYKRDDALCLAIILSLYLATRVSELAAIKVSDIKENEDGSGVITLQRTILRTSKVLDDGTVKDTGYDVFDGLKGGHRYREIPLDKEAMTLIKLIRETNKRHGEPNNSYLFIRDKKFIKPRCFEARIKTACRNLNMPEKTIHKLRKTRLSSLIKAGLSPDAVRTFAGHSSRTVLLESYIYDLNPQEELDNHIKSVKICENEYLSNSE